ncbi:cytoplasmic protein [Arthrobacter sp. zg-Y750]|uniref:cytoplasmic protein n=1 Tax=Arthrobacter sp. zg-Y750 TaxID=2894189 RepID=UPI001E447A0B|nr:cytoplasmic protein [Arthrobacter sp. zg-Y750]MCC9178284.1 cytoplasmic protein [Arthrobacter sp. zg-Y750]
MAQDPVESNPDHYAVVFENERVRVLEYRDTPGHISVAHRHPDSVMITASSFQRRLHSSAGPAGSHMDVELPAGAVRWLPAQEHYGENTGETETHVFFVELKEPNPAGTTPDVLGPAAP